ncbi:hypothetical protein BrE312_0917 [Brenneria sp. EniD312]|nr:hypothetical protein BrE312_0917 [Brenneria sp. EniD312]
MTLLLLHKIQRRLWCMQHDKQRDQYHRHRGLIDIPFRNSLLLYRNIHIGYNISQQHSHIPVHKLEI